MMRWYSARLLYESVLYVSQGGERLPPAEDEPLFEEQLIVFRCRKDEDVVAKLMTIAKDKEDEYEAAAGNWVEQTFREILEIQDVMGRKITDGTEVFYRFWSAPDEEDFARMRKTETVPWWRPDDDAEAEDSN
jgi:hypothetical protein